MATVKISFPKGKTLTPEVIEQLTFDLENQPVRALTRAEREDYSRAVVEAVTIIPAFREAIALIRPFMDATNSTAYTDKYARVGLSYWFFHMIDLQQQASVILHECMHVLNNHFIRREKIASTKLKNPGLFNIAEDLEINTVLDEIRTVDISVGVIPGKAPYLFPKYKSMEQYFAMLLEAGHDNLPDSRDGEGGEDGSANGSPGENIGDAICSSATDENIAAADAAGIERASDVEQTSAKQNVASRIRNEKNSRGRGLGAGDELWDAILRHLEPPKVSWQQLLRRAYSAATSAAVKGSTDYSYRRPNRRMNGGRIVFPSMVTYNPTTMVGVDTSGSMGDEDFQLMLNELEGILKAQAGGKNSVSIFSVDTKVSSIKPVASSKKLQLSGGGGTKMSVAWEFISTLPKAERPDIFILVTDGGIDWDDVEKEVRAAEFKSIICVTQKYGFECAPESLKRFTNVIDISPDEG